MKTVFILFALLNLASFALGQNDVQKLVDTEHAFARLASEKGTKAAFLEYLASDGLLFLPDKINGRTYWNGRGESTGLLSWAPNYADISANGVIGYTTGNWEYRPKGPADSPTAFGEFITVWLRQPPDGRYRFVIDIGVAHARPEKYSSEWITAADTTKDVNEKNSSAADKANGFYTAMASLGLGKAYETYAADDMRAFREERAPILGKKSLVSFLKKDKAVYSLAKRSTFFGSADIAYNTNTYTKTVDGKIVEKGNTMQIWKLVRGKWLIVLDVFKPVP